MGSVLATWVRFEETLASDAGTPMVCRSERNNVGILAAAAWCSGGVAIEEFATRRGERWPSPGRNDLYLRLGQTALCIEAKVANASIPASPVEWENLRRLIRLRLRTARHEAVSARAARDVYQFRVGLVFCVLKLRSRQLEELERHRGAFIRELPPQIAQLPTDFWAVHLPGLPPCRSDTRLPYAGVFLIGSTIA